MSSVKTIRSQPPDVTVVVGSGRKKKEFKCYGVILAAASPVLDVMLSSGMKESKTSRIELPDKIPDDFMLFLECIDPSGGILSRTGGSWGYSYCDLDERNENNDHVTVLNESNVRSVVPLFHEFQMEHYLAKCDAILFSVGLRFKWDDTENTRDRLELLAFATKHDLEGTRRHAQRQIETLLERFCWGCGDANVFDITTIETIVDICRPLNLVERKPPAKKSKNTGRPRQGSSSYESYTCKNLWAQISSCIEDDLSLLPIEEINGGNTLSRMIFYALQRYHKTMKAEFEQKSAALIGKRKCYLNIGIQGLSTYESKISIGGWNEPATREFLEEAVDKAISNAVPFDAGVGNFSRSYEIFQAQNTMSMAFEPSPCHVESRGEKQAESTTAKTSKLRFSSPDLVVKVGSGRGMKKFQCHGVLLSFASTKLESLIGSANGILSLPHIRPDDWQQFYGCINPHCNGRDLNADNVHVLIPLFQEFEMQYYLERSVCIMKDWHYDDNFTAPLQDIIDCLKFAVKLGFKNVQQKAEHIIGGFFEGDEYGDILMKLDAHAMKDLMSVCLPVQRNSSKEPFTSAGCPILWEAIVSYLEEYQLESLTFDKVKKNDLEMFSNLIYQMVYFVGHEKERRLG